MRITSSEVKVVAKRPLWSVCQPSASLALGAAEWLARSGTALHRWAGRKQQFKTEIQLKLFYWDLSSLKILFSHFVRLQTQTSVGFIGILCDKVGSGRKNVKLFSHLF